MPGERLNQAAAVPRYPVSAGAADGHGLLSVAGFHWPFPSTVQPGPMAQYVYTMNRVGKIVPPKRVILKDISLSFFPGA